MSLLQCIRLLNVLEAFDKNWGWLESHGSNWPLSMVKIRLWLGKNLTLNLKKKSNYISWNFFIKSVHTISGTSLISTHISTTATWWQDQILQIRSNGDRLECFRTKYMWWVYWLDTLLVNGGVICNDAWTKWFFVLGFLLVDFPWFYGFPIIWSVIQYVIGTTWGWGGGYFNEVWAD